MSSEYKSIKESVLKKLEEHLPEIKESFGIEELGIFGSVSRGEDTQDSDVDILYRFAQGRGGLHDMSGLYYYLEDLFDRKVDLISIKYISPLIEERVLADAILCGKEMGVA